MFDRFTQAAKQVVLFAQEEARGLGHGYIGTEHELLGVLRERDSVGARSLGSLGITSERAREQVLEIVGPGEEITSGQLPFTPRGKKVLELASREARDLGARRVAPEHILLGLVRLNKGVAMQILLGSGADAETVRREVLRLAPAPGP